MAPVEWHVFLVLSVHFIMFSRVGGHMQLRCICSKAPYHAVWLLLKLSRRTGPLTDGDIVRSSLPSMNSFGR